MIRKLALMFLLGLTVVLFIWAAKRQSERVNTDRHSIDQSAYMDYAKSMAQTNLQFVGGRNRMPIYPGLMSFFYNEGMSDEDFFERGKNAGIAIGLVGLAVAFILFSRVSKPMDALTGTLVAMFTVFAYKSPYFQTEVLFYAINLVLFYLLLLLVRNPQVRTAALAGLVGGAAHLTKASVLPALLLAALLVVAHGAVGLWRRNYDADAPPVDRSPSRYVLDHLFSVTVLLGCFLLVIFPYISTSKERFGDYFYNVNSTFYMWYDSADEVKQGTRAHGDRQGWPDMPEEQIPSFRKYVREHSLGEILGRLARGFGDLRNRIIRSYGYAEFLLAYVIALGLLFIQNKGMWLSHLRRRVHPLVLLFVLGYFLGYTLLYAWYTPIASGDRFILSLFLPAMLVIVWVLSSAQNLDLGFDFFGRKISASSVSPAVLLFLIAYVLTVFPLRLSTMFGGE
jgi:hypothetical protein